MKSIIDIVMKDKETKDSPALSSYLFSEDEKVDFLSTNILILNLLYSGKVNGGIPLGRMSMISAPTMLGKSFIGYGLVKNAQKKGMQVCIIDTERAFNFNFALSLGIDIDPKQLVVLQENSIEEVMGIITTISDGIPKDERKNIFFLIDSWGSLVTSRTMENALTGNDKADMTMAQKKNTLANIMLNTRATYFVINHTYTNTGGMGDPLKIPGGSKILYNCDSVVLGRSRAKEKKNASDPTITGNIIIAETHKSRFSREKSKLKYRIKVNGGLDIFYGILDDALEFGVVEKPKMGKYSRPCVEKDKEWTEKKLYCSEFWLPVFKETNFKQMLEEKYTYKNELDIVLDEETLDEITG